MEDLTFGTSHFEAYEAGNQPLKSKPGYLNEPSLHGRSYVIGVEFGQSAAGTFAPVCKIDADNIESDEDVDQLIAALQQTRALLRQLRHQTTSAPQK
jgi:hypothetical protein